VGDATDSTARIFGRGGAPWLAIRHCAPGSTGTSPRFRPPSNPIGEFPGGRPANYYAESWRENAIDGKQYGFPYDYDARQSSGISVTNPQ
jgi:hypothetical protein